MSKLATSNSVDAEAPTPELNQWLHEVAADAKARGYPDVFMAASDPSHPLGGGSITRINGKDESLFRSLRATLVDWERSQGIDPSHDWRDGMSIQKTAEALGLVKGSSTAMRRYAERFAAKNGGRFPEGPAFNRLASPRGVPLDVDPASASRFALEMSHPASRNGLKSGYGGASHLQVSREGARHLSDIDRYNIAPLDRLARAERRITRG